MSKRLQPDLYVKRIYNIPLTYLENNNIEAVIIDLDNTIVPWDSNDVGEKYVRWLDRLKEQGKKIIIVSNNREDRVSDFACRLDVPCIYSAAKPLRKSFIQAIDLLEARRENTVVVGDQIFTDVMGGNGLGLHTILVEPMAPKEFMGTKVLRAMERFVLKKIVKSEGFEDE